MNDRARGRRGDSIPARISALRTGISVLGCFAPQTSHQFEKRYSSL
ncbi:MAG: hypothetical protein F6J93_34035 [Oscillatoria sp. SIO1A7]|nr:hypothetical protein [Oscillatoria sp. SIO1A7]